MDIKTFDDCDIISDEIYRRQKQDVAKMRTSLLACAEENGMSARSALQNITAMQVYHQLTRIVRYLEIMDKLEHKLYSSIEHTIDNSDDTSPATWVKLLSIQDQLQKNMIASHKILEPYLNIKDFLVVELNDSDKDTPTNDMLMSPESRDRLRSKAQEVMASLSEGDIDG